jgi:hypothetical protein
LRPSPRIKFAELVERWRETIVPTIRESTAAYYNKTLDTHILPYFAVREVAGIEKYDVQKFLAAKAGQGFAKTHYAGCGFPWGESWDGQWKTNGFLKTFAKG